MLSKSLVIEQKSQKQFTETMAIFCTAFEYYVDQMHSSA